MTYLRTPFPTRPSRRCILEIPVMPQLCQRTRLAIRFRSAMAFADLHEQRVVFVKELGIGGKAAVKQLPHAFIV